MMASIGDMPCAMWMSAKSMSRIELRTMMPARDALRLGPESKNLPDGGLGPQSAEEGGDGLAVQLADGQAGEGHFQPDDFALGHAENAEDEAFGQMILADADEALHAGRVVGDAGLFREAHGMFGAHPSQVGPRKVRSHGRKRIQFLPNEIRKRLIPPGGAVFPCCGHPDGGWPHGIGDAEAVHSEAALVLDFSGGHRRRLRCGRQDAPVGKGGEKPPR